jgi:hypothetical protein
MHNNGNAYTATIEALDDHLKLGFPLKEEYSLHGMFPILGHTWSLLSISK